MAVAPFRIFISAVTNEFGQVRDTVAANLRARGLSVCVQSDLQQQPDTTLRKLHDYIRDCDAVVCIIGKHSGACPPSAAAAPFKDMLPIGINEASYTQWELFFANHFGPRMLLRYLARDDYVPDQTDPPANDRPDLQSVFVSYLIDQEGFDRDEFSSNHELRAAVLTQNWPYFSAARPIALPYPSLGNLFKGRAEFMERLNRSLADRGRSAVVSKALYGLGGIGKTRAAVEYAWMHRTEYSALLFVIADSPEALRRNFAALSISLALPEFDASTEEARLHAVLEWLNRNPAWFLILDNVDTTAALAEAEALLGRLVGGHVLITGRLANFPGDIEPFDLDVLTVEDAATFLIERTARRRPAPDDADRARALAVELGQLALALEHAGAFISRQRASLGQYEERLRTARTAVMEWSDPAVTHYPRAIAETWQTSVVQLTESARALLECLSWLAPEPIPESLLDVPSPITECVGDLRDALADLAAYSLVTRDHDRQEFSVHRLVQEVTRRGLVDELAVQRLGEALNWIDAAFAGIADDVRFWPVLDPLVPHARAIMRYADAAGVAEPTGQLMNQFGLLLYNKADYVEAEALLRRAVAIGEAYLGPYHPDVLARCSNLASLLQATNQFAEAEHLLRHALAVNEARLGPDHLTVAKVLNNLAELLSETNRLDEAERYLLRALAINQAKLRPDDPAIAIALNNLANALRRTNRLGESEQVYRRALEVGEVAFGTEHPNFAMLLDNFALMLDMDRRSVEAEPIYRRALTILETKLGPTHPEVATCLNNLGGSLQINNRPAEAEDVYLRALAITETRLGAAHPEVSKCLNNLAEFHRATNRLDEAEPLSRRSLQILIAFLQQTGHEHPYFQAAARNYRGLLVGLGRTKDEVTDALAEIGVELSLP